MSKLYALFVVKDESSCADFVCASNDINKLINIYSPVVNSWSITNKPNGGSMRVSGNSYPKYIIDEVPYVC